MFTVLKTDEFDEWLLNLRNPIAKKMVVSRILRLELGNFGDVEPVGDGVSELRFHNHGGIRVYFVQRGDVIVLLLLGGDKSSQKSDIIKAKDILKAYEGVDNEEGN